MFRVILLAIAAQHARAYQPFPIRVRSITWAQAIEREVKWRGPLDNRTVCMFAKNPGGKYYAVGPERRGALFCVSTMGYDAPVLEHVGFAPSLSAEERAILCTVFFACFHDDGVTFDRVGTYAPVWCHLERAFELPRP